MIKRLSILDMHVAIKNLIEEYSNLECLDGIPTNQESPFTFLEFVGVEPDNTKTMFIDKYTVNVHVISKAESNKSSINHYKNIQAIEEVFTKRMKLNDPFDIFKQSHDGLMANYEDETNEKHAVIQMTFWVSYGFKIKV